MPSVREGEAPADPSTAWAGRLGGFNLMTDGPIPHEIPSEAAQDLSRSYGSFLEQQELQPDDFRDGISPGTGTPDQVETGSSPPPLKRIVEALLFVGGVPLTPTGAAEVVRGLAAEQFTET